MKWEPTRSTGRGVLRIRGWSWREYLLLVLFLYFLDLSGGSDGKASAYISGDWVRSLGGEDPLEKGMVT